MNILGSVLEHDVFPALGCTEPIATAHAASVAAEKLDGEITTVEISVDPGVYKNGFAVAIPNTNGQRGNLIAGVLGALIRQPDLKMEIMNAVTEDMLAHAQALIASGNAKIDCDRSQQDLHISVLVRAGEQWARAVVKGSHSNLVSLVHNDQELLTAAQEAEVASDEDFRNALRNATVAELVDLADNIGQRDYEFIQRGVEMNLRVAGEGKALKKVSYYISQLIENQQREADLSSSCEVITSSAADARMGGLSLPVMASGGSGNQGIVAILVPYLVGKHYDIREDCIVRSIALSHLINSYIKCFTGDLSPLCGCAIAAGVGASAAIVYQRAGKDLEKITLAVNNLVSDLGGMLCDGAKEGCALKVASSTNSAIRSAHMALNNHGITQMEGFVGRTAEDTIRSLSQIGAIGMGLANDTMLDIMIEKATVKVDTKPDASDDAHS